ncbi:MAG: hypothetical protein M0Z96_03420 [Actinomycetota bacterium]|nr:hypothetical protein [Actinomycetota bacterium]
MWHSVILLGVVIAGLMAGFAIVITTDMFFLVDVTGANPALDPDEAQTHVEESALPTWSTVAVLLAAELLSLGAFTRSEGLLSYLALFLVLFSLFAITLLDVRWQRIPLSLFIPLGIGSVAWVLLHPITIWSWVISGGLALVGVLIWLTHPGRQNYGDLLLAIFVGLFCGAGITSFWQGRAVGLRLSIGICVGYLAILVYSFVTRPDNPKGEPFVKQVVAAGPLFLSTALFVVFLR